MEGWKEMEGTFKKCALKNKTNFLDIKKLEKKYIAILEKPWKYNIVKDYILCIVIIMLQVEFMVLWRHTATSSQSHKLKSFSNKNNKFP